MSPFEHSPWPRVRLGDLCAGKDWANPRADPEMPFEYVDIASVCNQSFEILNPKSLLGRDAPSRARKRIRRGDVLVATTRPYLRSIALVPAELDGQVCSTGFCVLRPKAGVISDWVFFAVLGDDFIEQLTAKMRGANYPAVADSNVLDAVIPLPEVAEQHRIVSRIKACMERVEEIESLRAEAAQQAAAITPSLLNEVFVDVTSRAPSKSIEQVALETRYGTSQKCHTESSGVPILRIPNVAAGAVNYDDLKYCELSDEELRRIHLVPGDLLFVRTNGSRDLVGRCAVFEPRSADERVGFASYLIRVRLDSEQVLSRYLAYFLNSTRGREEINQRRRTSAGQFNINSENLRSISFPVPPVQEQAHLIAMMDERDQLASQLTSELRTTETEHAQLRESILRRAFAGEL
jgi:type I restriction enzyme, S subunit